MIRREWQKLLKNKALLVVMIAIIAIPTIYTTLFLGSMWDPYGKLDNLPVAVVNKDKEITYNDKVLNVGKDLIEGLKHNPSLAFHFVDDEMAQKGLEDGTYYMVITIPEDFSAKASTLMESTPEKMELLYATNPGTNYIASKMSQTAVAKIKDNIETEVTKVYSQTMFDQIAEVGDGMQEAADGASKLQDGISLVSEGVYSYTDGVGQVAAGTSQLASNNEALNKGINDLSSGIGKLKGGSTTLLNGLSTISNSIETSLPSSTDIQALEEGLGTYHAGINQLNKELSQLSLSDSNTAISKSLMNIGTSTQSAADEVQAIAGAVATLSTANLSDTQLAALQTIAASTKALGGNLNTIGTEAQSVGNDFTSLSLKMGKLDEFKTAVRSLANNSDAVFGGSQAAISGLYSGLSSVKMNLDNRVIPGAESIKLGITQVQTAIDGTNGLKESIGMYTSAVSEIETGAAELDRKSGELQEGVAKVNDGTQELSSSLSKGAGEVKDVNTSDATVDMFVSPVTIDETQVTSLENNGHAMAPYMMSVALWVACIAFCIMYPLTEFDGNLKSGLSWWASKASVVFTVAIAQSFIMILMLNRINGFQPQEMGKTILVACLASLAFMSVMYYFNACLGKVGSFLMLIFMVVQLAGSAGTYPVELSGAFVGRIHKYLPFSYTVEAFRSTISGGGSIQHGIIVLTVIFVVFTALTIWLFQIRAHRVKNGKTILTDLLSKEGLA